MLDFESTVPLPCRSFRCCGFCSKLCRSFREVFLIHDIVAIKHRPCLPAADLHDRFLVHTQTPQIPAPCSPEIVYQDADIVQAATAALTIVSRHSFDHRRDTPSCRAQHCGTSCTRKSPMSLPSSRGNTRSSGPLPSMHIEMTAWTSRVILMTRASLFFVAPGLRSIV